MTGRMNPDRDPAEILVVEDSPTQADQLRYLLEQQHYVVTVAGDGMQALALLEGHKPSLVISDIIMPGMDGYALCNRIKSNESTRDIPVILLTSLSNSEDVLEGLAAGADNFLTKPYSEDYLLSNIEKILANRKARKNERVRVGVEIIFAGKSRFITADQQQMLTLLISTYEAAVHRNAELVKVQKELNTLNERLEDLVEERTAALNKEIAERKRAEEELKTSEKRFRDIADHSQVWIWEVDAEGKYTYSSRMVERILGYTPEEILQKPFYDFFHPDDRESLKTAALAVFALKQPFRDFINRNVHRNGQIVWLVTSGLPLLDGKGNLLGYRGVDTNITESKRAEAEKEKLRAQLQMAIKMEAVGRLAGGVAHDFNNALTGILGYGELLRPRIAGDPKALADLDEISGAAERAATLTRQLLTFARRQVIDPVNLDLCDTVKDLMKFFIKVAGEQIEVKTFLAADTPTVRADRGQVEQVIMNLIVNARDAMPQGGQLLMETGGVTLEEEYVHEHQYVKKGRYALLVVSDTGTGMDEATRERVFEPFFTTKAPDKGTGLGLSVVYGIVKQHNGFIHLYSEPGKGTTFRIYFPAIGGPPDGRVPVKLEPVRGGSETILLAEDEEAILKLAWRILKDIGYTVLPASNGEEAVETFRRHREEISLAVLDVVMPRMGGKEAYEAMAKENPGLKVLFMSGYSGNAIHEAFVIHTGTPFLGKPFAPTGFARKVREVLDG